MVQFPDTESELLGRFVVNIGGEGGAEVGAGGGSPYPAMGIRGYYPRKILEILYPKRAFLGIFVR